MGPVCSVFFFLLCFLFHFFVTTEYMYIVYFVILQFNTSMQYTKQNKRTTNGPMELQQKNQICCVSWNILQCLPDHRTFIQSVCCIFPNCEVCLVQGGMENHTDTDFLFLSFAIFCRGWGWEQNAIDKK